MVKVDDKVKVEYTGKLKNGDVFDSSKDGKPLEFTVGDGKIIPGFDKAVRGMKIDEEKEISIESDNAYGDKKEELIQNVPMKSFPEDFEPEIGRRLNLQSQDGQKFNGEITTVNDESITVDLNHPLAGEDLIFDIKLVEIN
ncbi:MAG: peptidylprolyl isomerase [Elusimicrobia bacterium]|jgi:FKBP-type peptidyl-prolyl cis-trans isomerase 2|nr:peptidylprolyl isomerase [Elusimicrobiota bacterium]